MVNVTMLCANRPRLLKQALDSIGDLSDATVTIRDAGMNDEVRKCAESWATDHGRNNCVLHANPSYPVGTGEARNQVISISEKCYGRGDYLYLSDDDVYFHPAWLRTLIHCYEEAWKYGFRVIGAYNHPYHRPIASFPVNFWHHQPLGPNGEQYPNIQLQVDEVLALALQSMLMRWEVWDTYGPFRDTPPGAVCQGEDVEFGNKIREAGFKLGVISPALLVNCGVTNSFGQPIPGADFVRAQCPAGVICE